MNGAEHGRRGTRYIADSGVARVCVVHHTRVRLSVSLFPPARIHVLTQTRPQSYASARAALVSAPLRQDGGGRGVVCVHVLVPHALCVCERLG